MKQLRLPIRAVSALCVLSLAFSARAELVKHKDWDKSPEFSFLASDAEKKAWKAVATEEEAESFVALFWAKRDPELKTPVNEFKEQFDQRVATADQEFKSGKKRGALTERGKLLILIGAPKSVTKRAEATEAGAQSTGGFEVGGPASRVLYQFNYELAQLPKWADVRTLTAKILVEGSGIGDAPSMETLLDGSVVKRLETKAATEALVHPELTKPPVYKTAEQAQAELKKAAEDRAEAERGPTITPAIRETLEKLLGGPPSGNMALLPLDYRDGTAQLMLQIVMPAATVPAGEEPKIAILVRGKDGKDTARREEPAQLQKSKETVFADRSLPITAGDYDVAVAIVDATGKVLASARRATHVDPLPTEFTLSTLVLCSDDLAFENPKPETPFTFSARKLVTKGDGRFDKSDGLMYAVRVYNPPVDPVTKKTSLQRSIKIKPKNGAAIDVPQGVEESAAIPEFKDAYKAVIVDLAGAIVDANLGQYFRPGEYEFRLKLTDGVTKKEVSVSAPFVVVGTTPPPAPAPPKKKG